MLISVSLGCGVLHRLGVEREVQASASIWFLAVWCLLGVLHVLWLLLVHRWHVLPFPVNPLPQEISLYSAHSCSLSVFGCTALCNSVGLPLSGLFFFLDSCRLFIVVPKACRCGVQVHRPNPCLFSFSDAWTLTFDLVLTFDADVYFYYVCFFFFCWWFFFFCAAKLVLLERLLKGNI